LFYYYKLYVTREVRGSSDDEVPYRIDAAAPATNSVGDPDPPGFFDVIQITRLSVRGHIEGAPPGGTLADTEVVTMPERGAERWTHPEVILIATDLYDLDRLMPFALDEARETKARLILFHVLAAGAGMTIDPVGMPYYDPAGAFEYAAKTLESWRGLAQQQGIRCDVLVREGVPAQQIAAAVRQFEADRIMLGTRSRSKVIKLLIGSVAEQVLRSVNIPVITVGPEAHLPVEGCDHGKVVLHATTLREASRPSAVLACRIAAEQGAKLVLLHVLPPGRGTQGDHQPASLDSAAVEELRQLARDTQAGCGCVEARVAHGNPSIEILATSVELGASLIILGATHRSALRNLARDRTIYQVLAHAPCPVLSLRESAVETPADARERFALHR
jgi:nucleotide-binding universal stress UspA family protein